MRVGIGRGALLRLGMTDKQEYRILSDVGFDSIDYSLTNFYTDQLWKLPDTELRTRMEAAKDMMRECGLVAGQTHSPIVADWVTCPETKDERWHAQVQAIKTTSYLGSPYTVIHPMCPPGRITDDGYYEYAKALNMEFFQYLEPYLREYNVKGAIENLFVNDVVLGRTAKTSCSTAENIIDYIETIGSDRYVACLDVGHATLAGEDPVEMIYKLGKKYLHVTHMHDNDYINDDHFMPGIGKIDWRSIGKALRDIEYDGIFNYEANRTFQRLGVHDNVLTRRFLELYMVLAREITNVK